MRQRVVKVLMLAAVGACIGLFGSMAGPATASAACSVTPNYPVQRHLAGNEFYFWGWAYVSGCGNARVSIYACEYLGRWSCSARADYVRPENANHPSLRLYGDCDTYRGSGRIATGWKINSGSLHVSTRVGWIC